jgi:hypothetical protein
MRPWCHGPSGNKQHHGKRLVVLKMFADTLGVGYKKQRGVKNDFNQLQE